MVNGVRAHFYYRNKRSTVNVSRETLHIMTDYLTWCINSSEGKYHENVRCERNSVCWFRLR